MQTQSPHFRVVNSRPSNAPAKIYMGIMGTGCLEGLTFTIYNVLPLVYKKKQTKQNKLKVAFFGLTLYISYVITNLFYA